MMKFPIYGKMPKLATKPPSRCFFALFLDAPSPSCLSKTEIHRPRGSCGSGSDEFHLVPRSLHGLLSGSRDGDPARAVRDNSPGNGPKNAILPFLSTVKGCIMGLWDILWEQYYGNNIMEYIMGYIMGYYGIYYGNNDYIPVWRLSCWVFSSEMMGTDNRSSFFWASPHIWMQRYLYWLVVWTPLKNISQLGWLFPIYGKIKNVPNHQPVQDGYTVCIAKLRTSTHDTHASGPFIGRFGPKDYKNTNILWPILRVHSYPKF